MDITDADRAAVLARYRALRRKRLGSPASCMEAIRDVEAWDVLAMLARDQAPDAACVRQWAAARDYRAAMETRTSYWFRRSACL